MATEFDMTGGQITPEPTSNLNQLILLTEEVTAHFLQNPILSLKQELWGYPRKRKEFQITFLLKSVIHPRPLLFFLAQKHQERL